MNITLTPELERVLIEEARRLGATPEMLVIESLQKRFGVPSSEEPMDVPNGTPAETERMAALMGKYRDTPMNIADASLVVVAESRSLRRVFTIDSDFYVDRLAEGSALEVVP